MAKATICETAIAGFENQGFPRVSKDDLRTGRYVVFRSKKSPETRLYFIGAAGAIRVGRVATRSVPVAESFKRFILDKGKEALEQRAKAKAKAKEPVKSLEDLGL